MAGRSGDVIEEVRTRTDIVDLISAYVPLRKSGQNFKANCPFHEEKTPSFVVSPVRQTFHCFGCGQKGGAFDFVMGIERVEFRDALALLADRAGVSLEDRGEGPFRGQGRAELFQLHVWAHELFLDLYRGREGEASRRYVKSRGISPEMEEAFGLCCAPAGWNTLVGRAQDAGFAAELLVRGGLALRGAKRPGFYDRFRERLMFPIRDALGRVIAFGARSLDGSEPKYLNSPETEIFHKGRTLFGIDRLKDHRREEPVLVMEGYTDVLMSAQVGVTGVVATLGTALTSDHARALARYAERLILVYDGDRAGLMAAERGAILLLEAGHLHIKVAVLPQGQDPCDFFQARGPQGLEELMDVTVDLVDFLLERSVSRHAQDALDGKKKTAEELLRAAAAVEDPLSRDLVIERIGDRLHINISSLRDRVDQTRASAAKRARSAPPQEGSREGAAAGEVASSALDRVHREILESVVNEPGLLVQFEDAELLSLVKDARIAAALPELVALREAAGDRPGHLLDLMGDGELRSLARSVLLGADHGKDLGLQLEGALACLKNRHGLEEIRRLARRAVEVGDSEVMATLQKRFQTLKGGGERRDTATSAPGAPAE